MTDISDYIGMIVAFVALLFYLFKQISGVFKGGNGAEAEEEGEELAAKPKQRARQVLRGLDLVLNQEQGRRDHEKNVRMSVPHQRQERVMRSEGRPNKITEATIADDAYKILKKGSVARGRLLLDRLPSKREMVVLSEIIGPPVSAKM